MLPRGSPGHRGSLATFSPLRPACSASASQLARELRDHVPYLNSPRQHLLRKEFVRRVGGQLCFCCMPVSQLCAPVLAHQS